MSNSELIEQFQRCKVWRDAGQWEILAMLYAVRGYLQNARYCLDQAESCQQMPVTVETVTA